MNKITRRKQQDIIEYYGKGIRIQKYQNDNDISIWNTRASRYASYSRIDLELKELKELLDILPDLIKEIEDERTL